MGRDVPSITVSQQDRRAYREKVRQCLDVFARMLRESRFETEPRQVGLEIELNLVDADGRPAMTNTAVLAAIADPSFATELGRFNLEINVPPRQLAGDALSALERDVSGRLAHAAARAQRTGSRLVMVGILPTLRQADVTDEAMSANPRYRLLNEQMIAARGEDMRICIDGPERLLTHVDTIMPEAACTSVQFHLQVSPEAFGNYWNAAQAVAGIQVALAANSPYLFGRELWRETRIPLFEQVTDTRPEELQQQGVRPRVWFGERWITSVFDLFEENLRYFPALLPLREDEDPEAALDSGEAPQLSELTLHNGTVYRWNRPVYAVHGGRPHLRVENRVLPAGPRLLTLSLMRRFTTAWSAHWPRLSGRFGPRCRSRLPRTTWSRRPGTGSMPGSTGRGSARRRSPSSRCGDCCRKPPKGLRQWGVDSADADRMLGIIEQRCLTGRTGATWQVETVQRLERGQSDRREALRRMTQGYIERMVTNHPRPFLA